MILGISNGASLAHRARLAVAVSAVLAAVLAGGCSRATRPRPVVLITVDALRADHVGIYGPAPLPTPAIDRLGREGAVVRYAVAPMGRTTQSVGTLLTGAHPLEHGADGLGMALPRTLPTLAELFRGRGYRTAAFTSNLFLRPGLGFERGFDLYADPEARWEGDSSAALTGEALAWVDAHPKDGAPWLLWVHYLDPHWTYEPPAEFARAADPGWTGGTALAESLRLGHPPAGALLFGADRLLGERDVAHVRRMYAGEVAATDHAIGALLDGLAQRGVLDDAIVVFTSDHGEALGAHGYWFGHGEYLYDDVLRVPWLVRAPGLVPAGTTVNGFVSTQDIAPTLLDLAGVPVPAARRGRSIADALRGGGTRSVPNAPIVHVADHVLVHPENPRRPVPGREGRWWAVRDGALKLIRIPLGEGRFDEELYDLAADPGETTNLASVRSTDAARLRAVLEAQQRELLAAWQRSGAEEPPAVNQETLRGLGYVQ